MIQIYFKYYDHIKGYVDNILDMKAVDDDTVTVFDHNAKNNNVFTFNNEDFFTVLNNIQESVNSLKLHIAKNLDDTQLLHSLLNKHPLLFINEYDKSVDKPNNILHADLLALESLQAVLDLAHVKYLG